MSLAPVADSRDVSRPESPRVSRPESPYVGLVPYSEADAKFFFGRSVEAAIVAANLRASRLTILYGPSGVGKSSLLMAGVVSDLRKKAPRAAADENPFAVCVFRSWCEHPLPALAETMRETCVEAIGDEELAAWQPGEPLVEAVRAWTDRSGALLVVLDQFEEYFMYHPDECGDDRLTGFADELARIVGDTALPVNILLSIREDAWSKLDRFEGHIPALFDNYLRVDHLDRDAAREAIEEPIVAWNNTLVEGERPFEIEPALVEAVLAATAVGGLTLTADSESPAAETAGDRVEAPFLQLVLDRIWRDAVAAGQHTLTLARLEALGGARRIVENHLLDALGRLTPQEQDIASDCARFLVSRSKTKIAYTASDLAEWTGRPEAQVTAVLDKLCSGESGRILRAIATARDGGSTSYELFHDILAEPILAWRRGHEQERAHRLALRRYVRIGGVLLSLVAVFAALGVWALVQRNEAISAKNDAGRAANSATSLALASAAGEQAASHFDVSLLLGLEAYRLSLKVQPGGSVQAASSMISALEAARGSGAQAILRGHQGRVNGVAISPDGRTLASAGDDGTLRLWDRHTHQPLGRPLYGHHGFVYGVAFSPDGGMLASAGDDGTVRLWDRRSHKQLGRLSGHKGAVYGVAFSPDERTLATAGDDGTVRLWDRRSHKQLGRLSGHRGEVYGVAFSPDGRTLASAGYDGTIRLWDVRTHKQLRLLTGHKDYVYGVAFSPDGRTLASAGYDGTIRIWDVRTHKQLRLLTGHKDYVYGVAFSPDGGMLASAGYDGTIRLWDTRTFKPLRLLTGHDGSVSAVAFSRIGQALASAGEDGTVRLWDIRTNKLLGHPLNGRQDPADGVALSPDGQTLAAAGRDGTVQLWNILTHEPLGQLGGGQGSVNGVAFSPGGRTLAAAGEDGTVWLWDTRTHKPLGQLDGGQDPVDGVAFSPGGQTLAAIGHNGTVRLWDTRTHKPVGKLDGSQGYVYGIAFSPDGQTLAAAGEDGTVWLWDTRTHKRFGPPLEGDQDFVYGVAFSPDGQTLAAAGRDGTVQLWNSLTHEPLGQPLDGRQGSVKGVAFSPDGRMLASGGYDGTIRLWDLRTRKPLGEPLRGHSGPVYGVAFSRDGRTLASDGKDGTVRLWEGILWRDVDDLEQQVCSLFFGNLTNAEWQEFAPGLPYLTSCSDS